LRFPYLISLHSRMNRPIRLLVCTMFLYTAVRAAAETPAAVDAASSATAAYAAPQPWAEPIRDYLAAGEEKFGAKFERSINGMTVFAPDGGEPLLWICYGDATANMSKLLPIEFRYFVSPDDPTHRAAPVHAAPPFTETAHRRRQHLHHRAARNVSAAGHG